eukprot:Skav208757  [mRNA]  locus=scaffold1871:285240:289789:+ [translate_table: standard]
MRLSACLRPPSTGCSPQSLHQGVGRRILLSIQQEGQHCDTSSACCCTFRLLRFEHAPAESQGIHLSDQTAFRVERVHVDVLLAVGQKTTSPWKTNHCDTILARHLHMQRPCATTAGHPLKELQRIQGTRLAV